MTDSREFCNSKNAGAVSGPTPSYGEVIHFHPLHPIHNLDAWGVYYDLKDNKYLQFCIKMYVVGTQYNWLGHKNICCYSPCPSSQTAKIL